MKDGRSAASADLAEQWLGEAYELVCEGWCQEHDAENEVGEPIEPSSAFARRWSAQGALSRLLKRSTAEEQLALDAFVLANLAFSTAVGATPAAWNDAPGRRQHEVAEGLLRAVSLVHDPGLFRTDGRPDGSGDGAFPERFPGGAPDARGDRDSLTAGPA